MPPAYTVQARVVDLRSDTPKAGDIFLVDTNACFWTVYGRAGLGKYPPKAYQLRDYPAYLRSALSVGAKLHWFALQFSELAHLIEKVEWEAFAAAEAGSGRPEPRAKEFRHNLPAERGKVVQEIESAWAQITAIASPLLSSLTLDEPTVAKALQVLKTLPLDGYDLLTIQSLRQSGVTQVVSDDGDFCTVPGITLFTSNRPVVQAAQAQGRLLVR